MPNRSPLIGAGLALAALLCLPLTASADPTPTTSPAPNPPLPNVNAYTPISPAPYTSSDGNVYLFAGPAGVTCAINRQSGSYACSGALPGAPDGANMVSGGPTGPPSFSTSAQPIVVPGGAKSLPPNTRLSFREISCGVDGAGVLACVNSRDQVGFVVGPTASYLDTFMPLVDRPGSDAQLPPSIVIR